MRDLLRREVDANFLLQQLCRADEVGDPARSKVTGWPIADNFYAVPGSLPETRYRDRGRQPPAGWHMTRLRRKVLFYLLEAWGRDRAEL